MLCVLLGCMVFLKLCNSVQRDCEVGWVFAFVVESWLCALRKTLTQRGRMVGMLDIMMIRYCSVIAQASVGNIAS